MRAHLLIVASIAPLAALVSVACGGKASPAQAEGAEAGASVPPPGERPPEGPSPIGGVDLGDAGRVCDCPAGDNRIDIEIDGEATTLTGPHPAPLALGGICEVTVPAARTTQVWREQYRVQISACGAAASSPPCVELKMLYAFGKLEGEESRWTDRDGNAWALALTPSGDAGPLEVPGGPTTWFEAEVRAVAKDAAGMTKPVVLRVHVCRAFSSFLPF